MNCGFVKRFTAEQRAKLLKLQETQPKPTPQYRVELKFWDLERTQIKMLEEYLGGQLHGKSIGWYDSGQKEYEDDWVNGQLSRLVEWHRNGKKRLEIHYLQDQRHGKCTSWDENGKVIGEEVYKHGELLE